MSVAGIAVAQSADDSSDELSTANLNIPKDAQILGKPNPDVRKATAIVNGDVLTGTDVDQRLALVVAANGGKIAPEERERLRVQVLSNLIDETLEIQEAKANDITVSPDEIKQTLDRVYSQNFKMAPDKAVTYLKSVGSSETSLKRQIEGELAWRRVLSRKVEPFINVNDDEVKSVMARLEASKGATEYHVGEIFLSATPATMNDVRANAEKIAQQVRQGGSFVAYARQYSEASTAAVGGDLGWVAAAQLPDALATAVKQMPSGSISEPIQLSSGYSIIALIDQRQVLGSDPNDALLSLKQVTITFPAGESEAAAGPKAAAFGTAMKSLSGCGTVEKVAATVGGNVVQNDNVRLGDLPPALRDIMANLQVGQASPPFGSLKDGVRVLVVCGRDEPKAAGAPSFDQIYSQMEEERVNLRARRYLRDLRRDAVIDYR